MCNEKVRDTHVVEEEAVAGELTQKLKEIHRGKPQGIYPPQYGIVGFLVKFQGKIEVSTMSTRQPASSTLRVDEVLGGNHH